MPSLGTPHTASKAKATPSLAVWAAYIVEYAPSNTQTVVLKKGAGTSTSQASVNHFGADGALTLYGPRFAGSKQGEMLKFSASSVVKSSVALTSLNGRSNPSIQRNTTLNLVDASAARANLTGNAASGMTGFISIMQNDATAANISAAVLSELQQAVPALETSPTDVQLYAGSVTSATSRFAKLGQLSAATAYDTVTGVSITVFFADET
jgi:hypothetical protein